jgi:phospholipid/cholesterol/gamma-HCH transport system substrate-binding protein
MPRTRSIAWSELKIGLVGMAALLLLVAVVFAIGGQGGFPWQRYPLKTRFTQVSGLKTGAVVWLNGMEVGKVTAVQFVGSQVDVAMEVSKDVRPLITTESRASLGSLSLLGEPIIDITAADTGTPLPDWAYVPGDQKKALADLTGKASDLLDEGGRLIASVRRGEGSVGKLFTDQALYNEMRDLAASAAVVAGHLRQGRGTLGRLMQDPSAYNELKASLEQLRTITEKANNGNGPLGRFLNDQEMGKSLAGTTTNVEQITARLNRGEGTLGKMMTDQELYNRFSAVATKMEQLVAGVEAGRGTAGALLKDRELYENMNQAAAEVRTLIGEIRKDPRKYLNVRVSIF